VPARERKRGGLFSRQIKRGDYQADMAVKNGRRRPFFSVVMRCSGVNGGLPVKCTG